MDDTFSGLSMDDEDDEVTIGGNCKDDGTLLGTVDFSVVLLNPGLSETSICSAISLKGVTGNK